MMRGGATISERTSTPMVEGMSRIERERVPTSTHAIRGNLHESVMPKRRVEHLIENAKKEELILRHLPWVRQIARGLVGRALPQGMELEELVNAGVIGLIDALRRFDPSREIRFETYAEFRVRGAIQDELRSQDWASKRLRGYINLLGNTSAHLEQQLGRAIEDREVAQVLGMSLERFHQLSQWSEVSFVPLDDVAEQEENGKKRRPLWETLSSPSEEDPLSRVGASELKEVVAEAIEKLPPRQRTVIYLYYFEELSMREIGNCLGVKEPRISQLHSQAIRSLKKWLSQRLQEA
ncbi:MAG: FliA/WhiG family RNA polymerase sigma factor [Candidatus Tectomicrobia bacterium]|uniref:FliA/WhiG family RNA polymerase sigma factor n=1 Tax=Tectimicrobiota bacterium TaxID=2528274 RepID=A0A932CLS1_UNCTE|nr:FliA/WhiG family RNA polymerase sigma factor [Candidatus Tectomicrobia bacterium]